MAVSGPSSIDLKSNGAFGIRDKPNGALMCGASGMPTLLGVSGAAVRKPKSTRKGHPHAFRLEVILG
jgi:hypothetical protein